jgi:osmoprotectant transport system permease protein
VIAGLDGVPPDVKESARGMGYGSVRMLLRVETPLALPTIMAGIRVATVSAVALTTVGAIVGAGGLGNLLSESIRTKFKPEILTASVLCVLLGTQKVLTPWTRRRSA